MSAVLADAVATAARQVGGAGECLDCGCPMARGAGAQADAARADAAHADGIHAATGNTGAHDSETEFTLEGTRCRSCVGTLARTLKCLPGVRAVRVQQGGTHLAVQWDARLCGADAVLARLHAMGANAWPTLAPRSALHLESRRKTLLRQLGVAGLSTLGVAMVALPAWLAGVAEHGVQLPAGRSADVGEWAGLVFALPALLYSARPFFGGAWRGLRCGAPGIDLALAAAIGAAFAGSGGAMLPGGGAGYFGSASLFIFLLLGSRYLELAARRTALGAVARLQRGLAPTALRLRGDPLARDTESVPAGGLRPGDLVLVQAGQTAPSDGIIHEGETVIDLALLSGASCIRQGRPGDTLPGGALNVGQAIVMRVSAPAHDSALALLVQLAGRAVQGKPALARRADRAASWFMGLLLALAALVFCLWLPIDAARGWQAALAVLMVASPCALSLAAPGALAAATDRLLRRGVLAVRPHTLETLDRATHVVFDKTGTLTVGRPLLRQALPVGALGIDECLRIAAALEADNPHPLAQPIRAAAAQADRPPQADAVCFMIGQGVEGWIDGRLYRLGSAAWVEGVAGGVARAAVPAGITSVWLGNSDGWLARFDLSDALRPDAAAVVARLRAAGKTVLLLSGDDQGATQSIAAQLGIAGAMGGKDPQEKLEVVRRLQREGAVVAMVGDGVDDAAVLRCADVSFAMGAGEGRAAELAQLDADGVLLGEGLQPLADAADTARRTLAVIRQNLAWVMLYNVAAIPAAALGLLQPWMAGAGMALSSALVVLNTLRLRRD